MLVEVNNVCFDENHQKCLLNFSLTQGQTFAFVQALDLGSKSCRHKKPMPKRYWGVWDHSNPKQSMVNILRHGAQWPSLPKT